MFHIDISGRTYFELLALLVGLYALVEGIGRRRQHSKLLRTGIRVEGAVVELKAVRSSGLRSRGVSYYPVAEYETLDSLEVRADYDLFSSNPPAYQPGEKVQVIYDPKDQRNFTIDNFSTNTWIIMLTLAGFVIVCAAIGYYILDPDSYIRF